ncbi:MAG: type II toxin-antitoxin system HipA family toxin YjjJ [Desulfotignum sp.]|nr:type II toxin-antitoxin system HipA family toxin YjjJ [Desulfotignum sp.]
MMESIKNFLERGPSTSKEIQAAIGLSQSTVSRILKKMGDGIVQISDGRSVRYAATCNAFGGNDKLPIGMIDESGKIRLVAYLRPLNCGGFFLQPAVKNYSPLLLGADKTGLYEDLPYFLLDLRPQGFLGRLTAKGIARESEDFPENPKAWNTYLIGRYLISNGDDLPGNFIFGEQQFLRIRRKPVAVSRNDYPRLATNAVKGEPPGSSAGGEQPKFTAFNTKQTSHVIVKFSPLGNNEVAQRWKDILITEYHAGRVLGGHGFPVAATDLFEMDGRLFLETQRFDRISEFGRLSMISLDMVDREFIGSGSSNWSRVMEGLYNQGMVNHLDLHRTRELRYFGQLINNTDMHLGNLSLSIEGDKFRLLPVYDMCSIGFAPKTGEVLPFDFQPDLREADIAMEAGERIREMVHEFWCHVLSDDRISDPFKDYLTPLAIKNQ